MNALAETARTLLFSLFCSVSFGAAGCSEFRARQEAREGNRHFREGDYAAAVSAYSAAEQHHPLAVVAFNKGLACRQLMMPGSKSAQNARAVECALDSFLQLEQLKPSDQRADQLYQQTLFDAERFDTLAQLYLRQLQQSPADPAALNGLIQVYSNAGQWDEVRRWTIERAQRQPRDAEAQYAVGVLIYNRLFEKGGGTEQSSFDPRPVANQPKTPPLASQGDITGASRVTLADQGVEYLERALAIRPNYAEALTYLGLLYRQKSFAFFDQPAQWQAAVDAAESYRTAATALHSAHASPQP